MVVRPRARSMITTLKNGAELAEPPENSRGVTFNDDDESDSFHDNGGGHDENDTAREDQNGSVGNRRATFARMYSQDDGDDYDETKPPPAPRHGSSLMEDLSDKDSELAHFLLAKDHSSRHDDEDQGLFEGAIFNNALAKSVRNFGRRIITGEDEAHDVGSLNASKAWFYSLALEPMEVRRDRIIMVAEAYAIFGALFLAGTWVLYEWGSGYGYGGCRWEEVEYCHPYVDRAFESVMALLITANLFQAMFSSFLWIMSILFSGSHRNWVYGSMKLLVLCHVLLCVVFILTVLGVGLGIYSKLTPYWPELAIALSFTLTTVVYGMWACSNIAAEELSLEYYHFPNWFKWLYFPYPMLRRGGRKRIRERAECRAKELRAMAYKERQLLNPNTPTKQRAPKTSVGMLLRNAADSIGRTDFDVSKYEASLEEDWYNDVSELNAMSVEVLSKYMPRRLAEEVHNRLTGDGVKARSIASGSMGDEGKERRLSWNNMNSDSE